MFLAETTKASSHVFPFSVSHTLPMPADWTTDLFKQKLSVENKKRREELAVYVLPKAMGSFWKGLEFKGRFKIPNGELLLNVM